MRFTFFSCEYPVVLFVIEHRLTTYEWVFFCTLYSVCLTYMFTFIPVTLSFDYCSIILSRNQAMWVPCSSFANCLAILGSLYYHKHFRIILSISTVNSTGILIDIMKDLWTNLVRIDRLSTASLLTMNISYISLFI